MIDKNYDSVLKLLLKQNKSKRVKIVYSVSIMERCRVLIESKTSSKEESCENSTNNLASKLNEVIMILNGALKESE